MQNSGGGSEGGGAGGRGANKVYYGRCAMANGISGIVLTPTLFVTGNLPWGPSLV